MDELLDKVRQMAGEVLGRDPDRIGNDDHLFDADDEVNHGGDSLDRADLAMALEQEFELDLPGDDIRAHFTTVRTIATYVASKGKGGSDV